jgi:Cu/Ag efflux protein CusF
MLSLRRVLAFTWVVVASASGCRRESSSSSQPTSTPSSSVAAVRRSAHGVIRGIDLDARSIDIKHDEIPGYMPAMTMPFAYERAELVGGLSVGDPVDVTFHEGERGLVIDAIARAGR